VPDAILLSLLDLSDPIGTLKQWLSAVIMKKAALKSRQLFGMKYNL
jgi:hypothetical protein